jgi:hypothetical protein
MNLDVLFQVVNTGVLPFWLLLVVAPRWVWTQRLVHSFVIPMLYGVIYVVMFWFAPAAPEGANMSSLDGVIALLGQREAAFAGWVHYLVFDLFVGAWITRDAVRRGIHHGLVVPCLVFTLMLGPSGLLLYGVLRWAMRRTFTLDESPPVSVAG